MPTAEPSPRKKETSMAATAAYVVGQKRFVSTMRKAGADMKELKEVNR